MSSPPIVEIPKIVLQVLGHGATLQQSLLFNLLVDLSYAFVDPRIDVTAKS